MLNKAVFSQNKDFQFGIESQANGISDSTVPFWMRSNKFGSTPSSGLSSSFIGRINKVYSPYTNSLEKKGRAIDWGFGFEGRADLSNNSSAKIIEAYMKIRLAAFQIKVGRSKDFMGLNGDSTLSSGNFAISGNALGIPKFEVSIPDYFTLPVLNGFISLKGNFAHGWLGTTTIVDKINGISPSNDVVFINERNPLTYFHQKSLYIKLGKPNAKLNVNGGFNHQVFWGNEKASLGPNFSLSSFKTLFYVITGKPYGTTDIPRSKIGNHLGSIDFSADYMFEKFKIQIYRQNFYDVGALSKLANISDGLNGITFTNISTGRARRFQWRKMLFELFYSKDQAGYPWSVPTKSGDEDYYNNFYYLDGWSYKKNGLGNPFITAIKDARPGQAHTTNDFFLNNRVIAIHTGVLGSVYDWNFDTRVSYSWNYGTFGTSIYGSSTGDIRNPQTTNLFIPVNQLSFFLAANKILTNNYKVGFAFAFDSGKLLKSSQGLSITLNKEF